MYFIKAIVSLIILALWCLYANAQLRPGNYDALWKNVEQAVKKGLTITALTEVKKFMRLQKRKTGSSVDKVPDLPGKPE